MQLPRRRHKNLLKRYTPPLLFILSLTIVACLYLYSRYLGFYSAQQIETWNYGFLMNSNDSLYFYLSKAAPLSLYNILNLYRFSIFEVTIFTPFILGLFTVLTILTFSIRILDIQLFNAKNALIFILFVLNPYVINLLCNDITGLMVAITTFLILKGIQSYEYNRSSRGILLIAIGLSILISSGERVLI